MRALQMRSLLLMSAAATAAATTPTTAPTVPVACQSSENTYVNFTYPDADLNYGEVAYCLFDIGAVQGMGGIYNFTTVGTNSLKLSNLAEVGGPSIYNVNLLGSRFNYSVCSTARQVMGAPDGMESTKPCGSEAITPEQAHLLGYPECAQFLYTLILNVFTETGGSWVMPDSKVYLNQRHSMGDFGYVAAVKTAVRFIQCFDPSLGSGYCNTPCPVLQVFIYSIGADFVSCPYRGSASMTLTNKNLASTLLVTASGTDSWSGVYDDPTSVTFVSTSQEAVPTSTYTVDIANDWFTDQIRGELIYLMLMFVPSCIFGMTGFLLFAFSSKEEKRRPFDLIAGLLLVDAIFTLVAIVWYMAGHENDTNANFNNSTSHGSTSDSTYPIIIMYCQLLSWLLYGAVAHDLIHQVRNPFDRGTRANIPMALVMLFLTALYLYVALGIACSITDCHIQGYSNYLYPWVSRKYTHYYDTSTLSFGKTTVVERFVTLFMIFYLPAALAIIYAAYGFFVGKKGLRGGLGFSHSVRKKAFLYRKYFFLGHAVLLVLQVCITVSMNESGHCIDYSGLKLASAMILLKNGYNLFLYLTHAPGPHRRFIRYLLEARRARLESVSENQGHNQRDTLNFSRSKSLSPTAIELEMNPTADHSPISDEDKRALSRYSSNSSPYTRHEATPFIAKPAMLLDEDAVLRAEVVHLVADGVWLSTTHSAQIRVTGSCCANHQAVITDSGTKDCHRFAYPAYAGSTSVSSWLESISGAESYDDDMYEFTGLNSNKFSELRIHWYNNNTAHARASCENNHTSGAVSAAGDFVLVLDGSEREHSHASAHPHESDKQCEQHLDTQHLSTQVDGDLDDGELYYLKSVEVPEDADDLTTIIKELWNTGGKSGAPLYFSGDKKLVIKMLDESEYLFLASYSLKYCDYMLWNPASLLTRVNGLYMIKMRPQQDWFRFVIMANAAYTDSGWNVYARYDLKGSTSTRRARRTSLKIDSDSVSRQWTAPGQYTGTLLDQDYEQDAEEYGRPVEVSEENKAQLMAQLLSDVTFLAENQVMDYSLFVCRAERRPGCTTYPLGYHQLHCVPSQARDDECFFFSFLDITQRFNFKKSAERWTKVALMRRGAYNVSSSPPGYYARRFLNRMNEYIRPELPADHPVMQMVLETNWDEYDYLVGCCV